MGKLVVRIRWLLVLVAIGFGSNAVANDTRPQVTRPVAISEPNVQPGGGGGVVPLNPRGTVVLKKGKAPTTTSGRP